MSKQSKLIFSGLWLYPIALAICYGFGISICRDFGLAMGIRFHCLIWGLSAVPSLILFGYNFYLYLVLGQRDFSVRYWRSRIATDASPEKYRAQHPQVPVEYLSKKPEGFILGKYDNRYVRIPIDPNNIMHACIVGAPGSGKSAGPYLCTLIANFMDSDNPMTVFCIDIKPELAKKSVEQKGNPFARIVNPLERSSWGWDVYYQLDEKSSDDEVLDVLDEVAQALIISNNPKDRFFVNNARTIFKGLMLYYYRQGQGFIDSVNEVVSNDLKGHIEKVLKDPKLGTSLKRVKEILKKYEGKQSEAFQDIELTMNEHLNIFLSSQVKWALRDNPRKACPLDLNNDISIFLSIPEEAIERYKDLFRLCTCQVLSEMERRPEYCKPIVMILDEFARIKRIEKIMDSLATLRSRRVSIWMAFQDFSQLEKEYSKEEARAIWALCEVKCILSCSDNETLKKLCELAGHYKEKKVSYKTTGIFNLPEQDRTVSFENRPVLQPEDIAGLRNRKEVMLLVEGSYYCIERLRYYEDSALNRRYLELMEHNK